MSDLVQLAATVCLVWSAVIVFVQTVGISAM
jgi:hypothetical protein